MVDILQALGELAEKGPIVVSLIAFGAIYLVVKMMMAPVTTLTKESVEGYARLSESIDGLNDTCQSIKDELGFVKTTVGSFGDSVTDITGTLASHKETLDDHETRIYKVEEKVK